MEYFEKIKEISRKEAKDIPPENVAYITTKDGEILIVNGLDHNKYDQREKEYESYMEEMSKPTISINNIETPLQKIQEDTEENERNSILFNQRQNFIKINNNNTKLALPVYNQNNLNNKQKSPFQYQINYNSFNKTNDNNQYKYQYVPINKNIYKYYSNSNQINYTNQLSPQIKYNKSQINKENYFINSNFNKNKYSQMSWSHSKYSPDLKAYSIERNKRRLDKNARYNNHSFVEIKQKKNNKK